VAQIAQEKKVSGPPYYSLGVPRFWSSCIKTDRHDINEILLKVALNTINQPTNQPTSQLVNNTNKEWM
jgi:hypothetical protein